MKKISFLLFISFLFIFSSCERDEFLKGTLDVYLYEMYPNASNLEWEKQDNYYVALFRNEGYYNEAWYDTQGNWYMTATTIPYINLPEAIYASLISAGFSENNLESKINYIKKIRYDFISDRYLINIRQDKPVCYFFTNSGYLFDSNSENHSLAPIVLSEDIKKDLLERYPKNLIYDIVEENENAGNGVIDVMMLTQGAERKMIAKYRNEKWFLTLSRISLEELPSNVRANVEKYIKEQYEDVETVNYLNLFKVYNINYPNTALYYFEIIIQQNTIDLLFDSEGKVIDELE